MELSGQRRARPSQDHRGLGAREELPFRLSRRHLRWIGWFKCADGNELREEITFPNQIVTICTFLLDTQSCLFSLCVRSLVNTGRDDENYSARTLSDHTSTMRATLHTRL